MILFISIKFDYNPFFNGTYHENLRKLFLTRVFCEQV